MFNRRNEKEILGSIDGDWVEINDEDIEKKLSNQPFVSPLLPPQKFEPSNDSFPLSQASIFKKITYLSPEEKKPSIPKPKRAPEKFTFSARDIAKSKKIKSDTPEDIAWHFTLEIAIKTHKKMISPINLKLRRS